MTNETEGEIDGGKHETTLLICENVINKVTKSIKLEEFTRINLIIIQLMNYASPGNNVHHNIKNRVQARRISYNKART